MRCSRCTSLRQTPRIGSTVAKKAKRDFVEKYLVRPIGRGVTVTLELTRTGTKRAESLLLAPLKTIFSGLDRLSSYERDTRASQTDNRG